MKEDVRRDGAPQLRRIVPLALLGARTRLGGTVTTASSGIVIRGVPVAMVGDTVSHPTLGDAVITTGTTGLKHRGYPVACAGSLTSREDDYIVDPLQYEAAAFEFDNGEVRYGSIDSEQD